MAYLTLVAAVLAVLAWNTGIRRLGSANAALFMNLVPVELLGMAVAVGAMATANLTGRRPVVTPTADHQAGSRSRQPVEVG